MNCNNQYEQSLIMQVIKEIKRLDLFGKANSKKLVEFKNLSADFFDIYKLCRCNECVSFTIYVRQFYAYLIEKKVQKMTSSIDKIANIYNSLTDNNKGDGNESQQS